LLSEHNDAKKHLVQLNIKAHFKKYANMKSQNKTCIVVADSFKLFSQQECIINDWFLWP